MIRDDILIALRNEFPKELADSIFSSYENAITEYKKENWSYVGNEIGQFIETCRRIIEYKVTNKYTAFSDKLSIFSEKVLTSWENNPNSISESYRILIPRILYGMYCLRNKRGMIHKSDIDPNKMDATVLLNNAKWILAELFRQATQTSFDDAANVIDAIMSRETIIVWDTGFELRVLDTKMKACDKVLCLLYKKDKQTEEELRNSIEYKNRTNFRKILVDLHKERLIEYSQAICHISPKGIDRAEFLMRG